MSTLLSNILKKHLLKLKKNTIKWSRNLSVDFVVMLDLASKLNCVYCSFSPKNFNVCLFGFFWQNNFYLSSVGELLLQKTALVRMIKKDDYSVKNKSSNVTVSRMGKCYSRFPSSHFFVLCPRRKLKKDRATDSNIAYFLYKPKKPIRIWLNHSWANQRKLIEVD